MNQRLPEDIQGYIDYELDVLSNKFETEILDIRRRIDYLTATLGSTPEKILDLSKDIESIQSTLTVINTEVSNIIDYTQEGHNE